MRGLCLICNTPSAAITASVLHPPVESAAQSGPSVIFIRACSPGGRSMGQVRRRQCLIAVGALVAPLAASEASGQALQKVYRVAHLSTAGRTPDGAPPRALRASLERLAYVEGRNVVYEARFAEGNV